MLASSRKRAIFVIHVNGKHLLIHIRDKKILPSGVCDVRRIDTHTGSRLPALTERYARFERRFFPLPCAVRSWAAIHVEKVLHGIVRNEEIHPAIIIDIGGHDAKTFAFALADDGFAADFGERAIAIVVIKKAHRGRENFWYAVVIFSQRIVAAATRGVRASNQRNYRRINRVCHRRHSRTKRHWWSIRAWQGRLWQ